MGSGVLMGWTTGLLGLQGAILGLYGCSVVGNAVRRDISAGLLESHRLMPVSAGTAVLGYVTGPTLQAEELATLGHGEVYEGKQVGVRCCKDL